MQVNESAGELDEAFVEVVVGLSTLAEPEFFKNIVRLVEELLVETFEVPKIMRVEALPVQRLDHFGDARALLAHAEV